MGDKLQPFPVPDGPLMFRYHFTLKGGRKKTFEVALDPQTLQIVAPPRASYPVWTQLANNKCPNCPLNEQETPYCPAAVSVIDVVDFFNQSLSFEEVDVEVETKERRFQKRCSLQEGVGSLMGLYMPASGCPIMAKFRPMARYHLPFASSQETLYRFLSMILLAQYFLAKHGQQPDWAGKGLLDLCQEIQDVDKAFFQRIATIAIEDAALNALVRLHAQANAVEFIVDQGALDELDQLFGAYFVQPPSTGQGAPSAGSP